MKVAILSLLAIGVCGWTAGADAADDSVWEKDFELAKLTARRDGKPIFLTFR